MATVSEKLRTCGEGQESLRKIGVITEGPIHNINDNIRMAFAAEYDASCDETATIKEYAAKLQLREVG